MKRLFLILRDQITRDAAVLGNLDPERGAVSMTKADVDWGRYPEHKQRLALAAVRNFRDDL